jgi:hypothetical protein
MTCDPNTLAEALRAGFALGTLVGGCAVAAVGSAGYGCWLLLQNRRRRGEAAPVEPPPGHPDHPDTYTDDEARRDFDDLRAALRRRRSLLRRGHRG